MVLTLNLKAKEYPGRACFVLVYENLFQVGCMGLLPVVLHYNYSAGVHTVPVMKWVLLWVDFKHEQPLFCIPTTGYKGYVVKNNRVMVGAMTEKVVDKKTNHSTSGNRLIL